MNIITKIVNWAKILLLLGRQ